MPLPTTVILSTGARGIRSERGGMTAPDRAQSDRAGHTGGSRFFYRNWACGSRPVFVLKLVYQYSSLLKMAPLIRNYDNRTGTAGRPNRSQTAPPAGPELSYAWSTGAGIWEPGSGIWDPQIHRFSIKINRFLIEINGFQDPGSGSAAAGRRPPPPVRLYIYKLPINSPMAALLVVIIAAVVAAVVVLVVV